MFSVDSWARMQGCTVENPRRIKEISARLLSGGTVQIASDWPIAGAVPDGVELTDMQDYDVHLTLTKTAESALRIIPKIAVLGVGCKLSTPQSAIKQAFSELCEQENLCPEAFGLVCSIDRKAEEPGLLAFCKAHDLPFVTFSAEQLMQAEGAFSASPFVREITGVDNVCERSAVLGSGGTLFVKKRAGNGVTMAAASRPFHPDWRWRDE